MRSGVSVGIRLDPSLLTIPSYLAMSRWYTKSNSLMTFLSEGDIRCTFSLTTLLLKGLPLRSSFNDVPVVRISPYTYLGLDGARLLFLLQSVSFVSHSLLSFPPCFPGGLRLFRLLFKCLIFPFLSSLISLLEVAWSVQQCAA